ncbi:MAG TPA: penicillin-binding protein 1C, partial [Pinirhizobacter sp.]|nr:penicillin-binding protein 1C [Pinirhizobacter sp.]
GTTYTMRVSRLGTEQISFSATSDADAHELYWFVDDAYLGKSKAGDALLWQPERVGHFLVRVVDDHGRSDSRPLDVAVTQ